MNLNFTDDEKIKCFDAIASKYFDGNFGDFTKPNMDLLMFNIYLQKLIAQNTVDDVIDYNACSDYKISNDLGITQQRVSNYKIKAQLKYRKEFDWKKAFAKLIDNAIYDNVSKKVMINIPDPNLYIDIQNFIEESGSFVTRQLNKKVLEIRVDTFINLVIAAEEPLDSRKEVFKKLKNKLKLSDKECKSFDTSFNSSVLKSTDNIIILLNNISSCISPSNVIGQAFGNLVPKIIEHFNSKSITK